MLYFEKAIPVSWYTLVIYLTKKKFNSYYVCGWIIHSNLLSLQKSDEIKTWCKKCRVQLWDFASTIQKERLEKLLNVRGETIIFVKIERNCIIAGKIKRNKLNVNRLLKLQYIVKLISLRPYILEFIYDKSYIFKKSNWIIG